MTVSLHHHTRSPGEPANPIAAWKIHPSQFNAAVSTLNQARLDAARMGAALLQLNRQRYTLLYPPTHRSASPAADPITTHDRRQCKVEQLKRELSGVQVQLGRALSAKEDAATQFADAQAARKEAKGDRKTRLNQKLTELQRLCSSTRDKYDQLVKKERGVAEQLDEATFKLSEAKRALDQIDGPPPTLAEIEEEISTVTEDLAITSTAVDRYIRNFVWQHVPDQHREDATRYFIKLSLPSL